jgi:hypothetical protein
MKLIFTYLYGTIENARRVVVVSNICGMAILLLRTVDAERMAEWYAGTFALPTIRGRAPTFYLSVGDVAVLEILADRGAPDPEQLWVPVFGSYNLAATADRLRLAGTAIHTDDGGRLIVADPDKNVIVIEQCESSRATSGFSPGSCHLVADLAGLIALERRCAQPEAVEAYYRKCARGCFEGDTSIVPPISIRFVGEGAAHHLLEDRSKAAITPIFRVIEHDAGLAELLDDGALPVETAVRFNSAALSYFGDPEGGLFGIDERFAEDRLEVPRRLFSEDREILRRIAHATKDKKHATNTD